MYLLHPPPLETTGIAVGSGAVVIEPNEKTVAEAGKTVMDFAKNAMSLECEPEDCIVVNGDPGNAILENSKKVGANLILMDRCDLGSVKSVLLGSVSQKVSHGAECAFMTVNH